MPDDHRSFPSIEIDKRAVPPATLVEVAHALRSFRSAVQERDGCMSSVLASAGVCCPSVIRKRDLRGVTLTIRCNEAAYRIAYI